MAEVEKTAVSLSGILTDACFLVNYYLIIGELWLTARMPFMFNARLVDGSVFGNLIFICHMIPVLEKGRVKMLFKI